MNPFSVYRVSWLRAKARRDRWWEEGVMVSHEMLFVILAHRRDEHVWKERAERAENPEGKRAFAYSKMLVAKRRAEEAEKGFAGNVVSTNWKA